MFSRKKHAIPEHEAERNEAKACSIKKQNKNLSHEYNANTRFIFMLII